MTGRFCFKEYSEVTRKDICISITSIISKPYFIKIYILLGWSDKKLHLFNLIHQSWYKVSAWIFKADIEQRKSCKRNSLTGEIFHRLSNIVSEKVDLQQEMRNTDSERDWGVTRKGNFILEPLKKQLVNHAEIKDGNRMFWKNRKKR